MKKPHTCRTHIHIGPYEQTMNKEAGESTFSCKVGVNRVGKVISQANTAKPCYWLIYKTINFPLKIQIKILSALGNQCLQILIGWDIKCLT